MLKDKYLPIISKSLTPQAVKQLEKDIVSYVDRNGEILLSLDMSRRYSFADKDRQVLFDACGIGLGEFTIDIRNNKNIYSSNKIQSNPFYLCTMLAAGHFLSKGDEKMAIMVITYMSLMMYTSVHKGFFQYEANKQIMDYTIAHLDNTFMIRQFPSLFAFIQDNTKTVVNTYRKRLIASTDQDITYVANAVWTRIKGKVKKIAARFYANHASGNYLNTDTESYNEEDWREIDNVSFGVDRLTNKVYVKLINRQYDKRWIRFSMSSADLSYDKLCNLIEDIIDSDGKDGRLRKVVSSLIEFYLHQSGKPMAYVGKGDYIAFMKSSFGSNTEAKELVYAKNTIDSWLAENMYKYGKAKYGKTVQLIYRRAIYMFLIFTINYEAKLQ